MDASDDEGVNHTTVEEDAASTSSKCSEDLNDGNKGSELGSEGPASPTNSIHSENSGDDDEVHISEAEASDNESDNECSQKGESDAGSVSGDEKNNSFEQQEEEEEQQQQSSDEGENGCPENCESDNDSVCDIDERSGNNHYSPKDENDAASISADEDAGNMTDKDGNDCEDENNDTERRDVLSSPQAGDDFPEINIDSGEDDNDERSISHVSDEKESELEDNRDTSKNVASDNEDYSPTKSDNLDDNQEQETPTKEDDDESDEEHAAAKNGEENPSENDSHIASLIFGSDEEEELTQKMDDDDDDIAERKKSKTHKRVKVSVLSDEENEENKDENDEDADVREESEGEDRTIIEDKEAESDVEHGEEGVDAEMMEENETAKKTAKVMSDDDSDDEVNQKSREGFVSDFDLMLQKKKEENSRKRKRKDVDIINDSDDLIDEIITKMRTAADADKILNKEKKTATKKLKILPLVMSQLKKQDLKMAFLDQGVLNVIADWLAPLPDRSLPHLHIREGMIKMLDEFPSIDHSLLKSSGVGRVLMYLFKHPKETKENKERAGRLITEWARPIFNVTTDYHSLTKEEREQRDIEHLPRKKKMREQAEEQETPESKDIEKALDESDVKLRPGDKGWVGRARVPAPSNKDYVVRPKWNVEMELGRNVSKKPMNRFEKHMRSMQEKKRLSKGQRAVTISIEGRKMAI